jgi:hypothetical protein
MNEPGVAEGSPNTSEASPPPESQGDASLLIAEDLVTDRALLEEDVDRFSHAPIAGRVAELIGLAEKKTPMNIVLFGPWGSGKTSFSELLRRELKKRSKKTRLVTYNAWQFGGASLQRNFISHAANELGLTDEDKDNRRFHRGLYESRRSVELDFERLREALKDIVVWIGLLFAFVLLTISLVLGGASVFTDENFLGQIGETLPKVLSATAILSVALAVLKVAVDGARFDVEQTAPSAAEEFSIAFRDLVKKARSRFGYRLLVFFIDELDRCDPKDVVATLQAVRAFLNQKNCVFIVAADREALEQAFDALPQEVPPDEANPYYSAASEFIDKVFQHQVALPPLRGGRVSGFARDLVAGRARGIWKELEETEGRLFDRLLTGALIPSHVRSPRHVKILLNNFATNVRIAQARGLEWRVRALEIAKLTAFQTEFPRFAADLHLDPRLPALLLDPPSTDKTSAKVQRLLDRHRLPAPPTPADGVPGVEGAESQVAEAEAEVSEVEQRPEPPDRILANDDGAIARAYREQLRRYLRKTADIDGPRADLLYLEVAGTEYGLADPELGRFIEDLAVDDPELVIDELRHRWAAAETSETAPEGGDD